MVFMADHSIQTPSMDIRSTEIRLPSNSCVITSPYANPEYSYQLCTLNAIPTTPSLLNKSKTPLALMITPYRMPAVYVFLIDVSHVWSLLRRVPSWSHTNDDHYGSAIQCGYLTCISSNIAVPALCFTLIRLRIALAANIGGQSSPISSPQNLIAIGFMNPQLDWGSWFAVALPVSIVSVLLIWLLLLVSYQPARAPDGHGEIKIRAIRPTRKAFTLRQYWVVICVLKKVTYDFEQFAWTLAFLAMGGIALGNGVKSSGLMDTMDGVIHRMLKGRTLYNVVIVLSITVLIGLTFISHTIGSVPLVPIAQQVGKDLPGSHANLLIFLTGLICSTGMGMPVSGFPNQLAWYPYLIASMASEDDLGQAYLTNIDFLKNSIPASIIAALVVSTVGYLFMLAIGL
ncbi:hypothetical protein JVT61DRAFT_14969 [Boletus reticuloceps]|uniref:Uncharacterized protein n=1 Tax=Boletus reticuloceps TaxID=495285 RepID=A0A8I2YCE9_9AGAM|nr:hypothetical protein JVT61DRAFT_14969 [Boletus reticuloceps]